MRKAMEIMRDGGLGVCVWSRNRQSFETRCVIWPLRDHRKSEYSQKGYHCMYKKRIILYSFPWRIIRERAGANLPRVCAGGGVILFMFVN